MPNREAEEIVQANYELLKDEVTRAVAGRLRNEGIALPAQDLEAAYNEGWHGVAEHVAKGRPVTSLPGLLFTVAHRRAVDIYRQRREGRLVELDLERQPVELDLAARLDDREKLSRLLSRLKTRLNDKERRAMTLCILHGYTRPEAAALLGIEPSAFERVMDSASRKLAGVVAGIDARGCGDDEWARLMRDYALGALTEGERDHRRAQSHVEGPGACGPCRRYVRGLQGLAGILPPLAPLRLAGGHASLLSRIRGLLMGHGTRASGAGALPGALAGAPAGGGALSGALGTSAVKALAIAGATVALAGGAVKLAEHHPAQAHERLFPLTGGGFLAARRRPGPGRDSQPDRSERQSRGGGGPGPTGLTPTGHRRLSEPECAAG